MTKPLLLSAVLSVSLLAACTSVVPAGPKSSPTASSPAAATAAASGAGATCAYEGTGGAAKQVTAPATTGVANTGTVAYTLTMNDTPIALTLDREKTPCTVNSFVSLAGQGYFDGTACHRLVDGPGLFVLQCGDPTGTGSGGPGYQFADELSGTETYKAGTLAMANAGPGTNGSQFFIVYADSQLSPDYTVFGTTDAAGVRSLAGLAEAGQDGSYPDGSGKPKDPAVITSLKPA